MVVTLPSPRTEVPLAYPGLCCSAEMSRFGACVLVRLSIDVRVVSLFRVIDSFTAHDRSGVGRYDWGIYGYMSWLPPSSCS